MALVPCVTNANPSLSLLGSGGGGGGTTIVASTITAETLNISSITGPGGVVIMLGEVNISSLAGFNTGGTLVQNGLEFVAGAGIIFDAAPVPGPMINFTGSDGQIAGLSTINGVAYPPASTPANISTITTGGGSFGPGAPINLNPVPAPVQPNKWYMASVEITDMAFSAIPNATDCFNVSIEDATQQINLGTFNMAQVSTNRGTLVDSGFSVSGPYESLSTNAYFVYRANAGAPSTFVVTGGIGWLQPLN